MAARHLLQIEGTPKEELEAILATAPGHKRALSEGRTTRLLADALVANLFFEDSTRTRSSFEVAATSLGARVLNLSGKGSSVSKGETLVDTARNIDAMGPRILVMRHASSGAPHLVARHVKASVVNAGDGTHEHPSQALLDAFTLQERFGAVKGLRVLIVGDVLHSRVARSNLHCLKTLGAQVVFCGPRTLLPAGLEELGAEVTHALEPALPTVDAVMLLRMQLERQAQAFVPSSRDFARLYGMNAARAAKLKPHAVIMHPGPINRGVELASDVNDAERDVILAQVTNGVAVRMAILERCA